MISKILIATRGPVAARLIRAYKNTGVGTVAIFSEAEREAPHVKEADEAYCAGPANFRDSYLNAEAILTIAELSGAHSIHPGFGLLAADAHLRELCEQYSYTLVTAPLSAIEASVQQRLSPRGRIADLVDPGTFEELDAGLTAGNALDFPGYDEKLETARRNSGEAEAVVTGLARLDGQRVALFAMDPRFMMGSMGRVVGEKITRLFERATTEGTAVIGYCVSGGARMQEGILSLMQMAKVSAAVTHHSAAGGLYIPILTDPTTGGVSASFATEGDIILAEPGALIGFAGPRVIEQTTGERLPKGFQRAEYLLAHGAIDAIVARPDQRAYLSRVLQLHSSQRGQSPLCATTRSAGSAAASIQQSTPPVMLRTASTRSAGSAAASIQQSTPHVMLREVAASSQLAATLDPATNAQDDRRGRAQDDRRGGAQDDMSVIAAEPLVPLPTYAPFEVVVRSRDNRRPSARVLIAALFDDFTELHGDRCYGDDPALVGGIATLEGRPVTVLAIDKGADAHERLTCNFGGVNPEGYRKAVRLMKQAEKFGRPVITLVDTSGAYCGVGAEERGQASAIAQSITVMAELRTPTIALIVGQGGSGGALALATADRVWMAATASYSVISPEGCASILWKDAGRAQEAAQCLKLTATDLQQQGVIDEIIAERPLAGPSNYFDYAALRDHYAATLDELCTQPTTDLLTTRSQRLRTYGAL